MWNPWQVLKESPNKEVQALEKYHLVEGPELISEACTEQSHVQEPCRALCVLSSRLPYAFKVC